MNQKLKVILPISFLLAVGILASLWPVYPLSVKKAVITATSSSQWARYQKLTRMLALGMEQDEVRKILGSPSQVEDIPSGERWRYWESESTTGWAYIAEFASNATDSIPRLTYVENVEHTLFPDARRSVLGQRTSSNNSGTDQTQ